MEKRVVCGGERLANKGPGGLWTKYKYHRPDHLVAGPDHKANKKKEHVLGVFIDFKKAYDMLHVPTLMSKVRHLGIIGKMYNWMKDFLTNRTLPSNGGNRTI